jgi:hypothetical protein
MKLWHYTCEHGALALGNSGTLRCAGQLVDEVPALPLGGAELLTMVWATDMDPPDAQALGLTSNTLSCDRTAYRYRVPAHAFTHWGRVRGTLPGQLVDALELAHGAQPRRWWVSFTPVAGAHRDQKWRQV